MSGDLIPQRKKMVLVARQGREHQRYLDKNGGRLIVGCIPYKFKNDRSGDSCNTIDQLKVLVISSRDGNCLLFPKGGWEDDEEMKQAALREALEEAGVQGNIKGSKLGMWTYKSKTKSDLRKGAMFALYVTEELDEWPEMEFRRREWVTVAEAKEGCPHQWMREALDNLVRRLMTVRTKRGRSRKAVGSTGNTHQRLEKKHFTP